ITKYDISNPVDLPLYFSVGAHPGFRCPLEEHETFEDYYLEFDSDKFDLSSLIEGLRDKTKKTISLENKRIPLTTELFDNDALVFENKQIDSVSLCSSKSSHKITMQCHDWPYFGIWTKKSCRDFICLEPWYGIADRIDSSQELSEKDGIIRLEPKKSFSCTFDLDFE
ncbi:MAG: aldose 1-epimerase family protein, partial [Bacteroidia bacterium]|nr:aldose 1-epimerase family protein [Bacteroidia bacterium]